MQPCGTVVRSIDTCGGDPDAEDVLVAGHVARAHDLFEVVEKVVTNTTEGLHVSGER